MKKKITGILELLFISGFIEISAQDIVYNEPATFNPIVPGYFADPTIKKFGDTYYLYATTDGVRLASGEPQIWISKDFVNWYNQEIDIPYSLTNVWAPDLVKGTDGRYYYFHGNCEAGCNIYGYVSDSPMGPWVSIKENDTPVIPVNLLGNLPSLDQHYFFDDDSSLYSYFGTWINYNGGLGWVKIDPDDMFTILESGQIPLDQTPEIFEAPFMIKKNGKYILMYSSGDCQASSYRVQYSYGDSPTGPFTFGLNNPILETNEDGTIDGPGHHSIWLENDQYYIVYHRHDNPHSGGGEFRQLCIDSLIFENDSTIAKVIPTHRGVGYLDSDQVTQTDLAFGVDITASSVYHLVSDNDDYTYYPEYAVDANNGTMWRSGTNQLPQYLVIDLGSSQNIKRIMTQFEYATYYYQYKIEYSTDSVTWDMYVDKTENKTSGSPMIDDGDVTARYIKITIRGTEKTGMFAAIWNVKMYNELFEIPVLEQEVSEDGPGVESTNSLLVEIDAKKLEVGPIEEPFPNTGSLGGMFSIKKSPTVDSLFKVKSIKFDRSDYLSLSEKTPLSLSWNSPFTVSTWVINPSIGNGECIVVWSKRTGNLMGEYAALMYGTNNAYGAAAHWGRLDMPYGQVPEKNKWHHIVLTFDGMLEKIYVNGVLNNQAQKYLFIHEDNNIMVGYSGESSEYFTGSIASLRIYDKYFPEDSIEYLMNMDSLDIDYNHISTSVDKKIVNENVQIYYDNNEKKLIIDSNQNNSKVEHLKVTDLNGRTILKTDYCSDSEYYLPGIDYNDIFVVSCIVDNKIFSKLIVVN